MTLVPRRERTTMPRNLRKPNLKRAQERAKALETVEKRKTNLFSRLTALMMKETRLRPRWKEERW